MRIVGRGLSYKGTVIRIGNEKRKYLNSVSAFLMNEGFEEIEIPVVNYREIFRDKVGKENNNLMFTLSDRGNRDLVLAPEFTSVVQLLSRHEFKFEKDLKLFYILQCFRGERQQRGRWREFTQLGIEILNPSKDYNQEIIDYAKELMLMYNRDMKLDINTEVTRGLDYYKKLGFEIRSEDGTQLCGGGQYDGGVGFAIGVDRIMLY